MELFRKKTITADKNDLESDALPEFSPWAHFKAHGRISLMSVLSGNPVSDAEYSALYKGLDASEGLSEIDVMRRPITRKTKSGVEKTYDTGWLESERGAYLHGYVNALAMEGDKPVRVPVIAIASSQDPDFLARAFLGTEEERASISKEEFDQKVELTITRTVEEITSETENDGQKATYFNMGWSAEAVQDDATLQRDFMRHKGMSKPSGDDIMHSATAIVWREPERIPFMHKVTDRLRPWKENRVADPNKYSTRLYFNEFGKLHMRLKEDDMKVGFIRWLMRTTSVELNKGKSLSEEESSELMHAAFTKAVWQQKRFLHPYDEVEPTETVLGVDSKKIGPKIGAFTNKFVKKIGSKTLNKFGNVFANFNKKGAIASAIAGAAVGALLVSTMWILGLAKGAQSLATNAYAALLPKLAKKTAVGVGKGGAKVLSPIVPLALNKRFDKSPMLATFKPKLRANDDLGGWSFNFDYLDKFIPLPYDFIADTYPDAPEYSQAVRERRQERVLINPDSLAFGTHGDMETINGTSYFTATEPTGIKRYFDTTSLTCIAERIAEPCAYSALDGVLSDAFDKCTEDKPMIAVRWSDLHKRRLAEAAENRPDNDNSQDDDPNLIYVSSIEDMPEDFVVKRTKSIEQFSAEVAALDDFDTAEFVESDFMTSKQQKKLKKTADRIEKDRLAYMQEFERKAALRARHMKAANDDYERGHRRSSFNELPWGFY